MNTRRVNVNSITKALKSGESAKAIAKKLNIGIATVYRVRSEVQENAERKPYRRYSVSEKTKIVKEFQKLKPTMRLEDLETLLGVTRAQLYSWSKLYAEKSKDKVRTRTK